MLVAAGPDGLMSQHVSACLSQTPRELFSGHAMESMGVSSDSYTVFLRAGSFSATAGRQQAVGSQ